MGDFWSLWALYLPMGNVKLLDLIVTVQWIILLFLTFFILRKIQTFQALGQDKMALSMSASQEHIIFLLDCINFTDGNLKEN